MFLRKPFLTALALRGGSSLCMNGLLGPAMLQALSGLVKWDPLSIEKESIRLCSAVTADNLSALPSGRAKK